MIVKIQVPITTNDPHAGAMVYNEDRSYIKYIPITNQLKRLMGKRFKAFFDVTIVGGGLHINHEVDNPGW